MSNISSTHTVELFDAKKSKALTGQRLAKIGYKSTSKAPAKAPSICVSVPHIQMEWITDNITRLAPYIADMLEKAQDGIVRSLYESRNYELSAVHDEEIGIGAIIGYLESESTGGRLTKEYLEQWFDAELADNLYLVLGTKLGYIDADNADDTNLEVSAAQDAQIKKHLRAYRDMISALSGGKTIFDDRQIKGLKNALGYAGSEDDTYGKLMNRLIAMENKPKIEDVLML